MNNLLNNLGYILIAFVLAVFILGALGSATGVGVCSLFGTCQGQRPNGCVQYGPGQYECPPGIRPSDPPKGKPVVNRRWTNGVEESEDHR